MSLLLASLALPAAAQSRFGLGLDLLFEHQESLEVSAFRGTILTRDLLNGGEQSAEQPSDPALLNRKFDFLWELEATGVELPIDLPGRWGLDPRLVLQAGVADVSLDFIGLRDRADNAALSGRGPLFGAEFEVEGSLFGSGPLSWSGTLRWQRLPSLSMDRSPAFRPEGFAVSADGVELSQLGFEVIGDEVTLGQEIQELTTRVGYRVSGGTKSYLGVRYRRTDVTIEDELGYVDPLREVATSLASQTGLENDATLAVAGVEIRPGPRLYSRVETAIGEGDRIVLAQVLYRFPKLPSDDLSKERVAEIAAQLARIRTEFLEARSLLVTVDESLRMETVVGLINQTEQKLINVLIGPEFAAVRDYVRNRATRAREQLVQGPRASTTLPIDRPRGRIATVGWRSMSALEISFAEARVDQREAGSDGERELNDVEATINTLLRRFVNNDLKVDVCVRTTPKRRTTVRIRPESGNRDRLWKLWPTNGWLEKVPRGDHLFSLIGEGSNLINCLPENGPSLGQCDPWNLMDFDNPYVECNLKNHECFVREEDFWRFKC